MINRNPMSDLPKRAPSVISPMEWCRVLSLWLLLALLMAGTNAARAVNVVTITNSPSVVSNTFNGVITLQINGLTNGVTNVIVQKYLDVNTNGVIDGNDLLVQQFPLAVGQASQFTNGTTTVTVTNFQPADMTLTTTGQITAPLNFQNGGFAQTIAGQYIYRVSSPLSQFTASTSLFTVTNMFYSAAVTGEVFNANTLTGISNATVLLFANLNGTLNLQAGTVATTNGTFMLRAPPGFYLLAAAKSNFVASLTATPVSFLANFTNAVNVPLTPSTTNITGKVVNATNSNILVPGLAGVAESTNNLLSLYFTDPNGNFVAPVTSNAWVVPVNNFAASFEGYLTPQTNLLLNVSNKVVNVTNALTAETAIFYGVVTNNTGTPMPGVYLTAVDNANHQSWTVTDKQGNYVLPALGGTNLWRILIPSTNNPGLSGAFSFSPGYIQTTINTNQAIQQNFGLNVAPYFITGTLADVDGNPISGVTVLAAAANGYQAFSTTTAANGTYSLSISPGVWTVGLDTNSLLNLGLTNFPASQTTNLTSGSSAVINFSILVCGEISILTTNLPNAMVGSPYSTTLLASSCQSIANWSPAYGITLTTLSDLTNATYPPGTVIYSDGQQVGYLESYFAYGLNVSTPFATNCTCTFVQESPTKEDFFNLSATVNITGPITNAISIQFGGGGKVWTAQPTTQSGSTFTTVVTLSKDSTGYNGKLQITSYNPGTLINGFGNPSNTVGMVAGNFRSPSTGNSVNTASQLAYTGPNDSVVWIQSGANLGQYLISADGPQITNLPPGLALSPGGTLSGTPTGTGTNNGTFNFTVAAQDTAGNVSVAPLSLFIFPATTLSQPVFSLTNNPVLSSNVFTLQVNGVLAGQNYTLLMSTNLASTNWIPIFTTNAPNTNAFIIPDPNASNSARFYRIWLGP